MRLTAVAVTVSGLRDHVHVMLAERKVEPFDLAAEPLDDLLDAARRPIPPSFNTPLTPSLV